MRNLLIILALLYTTVATSGVLLYSNGAESGGITNSPGVVGIACSGNCPTVVSTPVPVGSKSFEFHLTPTSLIKYRTEGVPSAGANFTFGTEYWIRYNFRASNWPTDTLRDFMMQIHEAPDEAAGGWANWAAHPECSASAWSAAPFYLATGDGQMLFNRMGGVTLWTRPVDNLWHKLVIRVKFAQNSSGFLETWLDNVKQPSYFGQTHRSNMASPCAAFAPPFLKLGIYKWDWKTKVGTATVRTEHIDEIKIASGSDGLALVDSSGSIDTTPPVISAISESSVTSNGAVINWTTDEGATERIDYGTTTAYGANVTTSTSTTTHAKSLTGLVPNTLYNYKITSCDILGNCGSSANRTFTTAPVTSEYTNVSIGTITDTSATVTWTAAVARSSRVDWGTTTAYGTFDNSGSLFINHTYTITVFSNS